MDHDEKTKSSDLGKKKSIARDPFEDLDLTHWDADDNEFKKAVADGSEFAQEESAEKESFASDTQTADLPFIQPLDLSRQAIKPELEPPAQTPEPEGADNKIEIADDAENLLEDLIAQTDFEFADIQEPDEKTGDLISTLGRKENYRDENVEQNVIFSLLGTNYAIPILNLSEIGRPLGITPVPNLPPWVKGVSNLRGEIISIVDLKLFFGLPKTEMNQSTRLIVTQTLNKEITIGFLVDQIKGISFLEKGEIKPPSGQIADRVSGYLRGVYAVGDELLALLNLEQLLLSAEMQQFN